MQLTVLALMEANPAYCHVGSVVVGDKLNIPPCSGNSSEVSDMMAGQRCAPRSFSLLFLEIGSFGSDTRSLRAQSVHDCNVHGQAR